jgi:alkylated DNA repair dioxygenase AlkB
MPPCSAQPPWAMARWNKKRPSPSTTSSSPSFLAASDEELSKRACRVEAADSCRRTSTVAHVNGEDLHVPTSLVPLDMTPHVSKLVYELACMRRAALEQLAPMDEAPLQADEAPREAAHDSTTGTLPGLVVERCRCQLPGVCERSRQHQLPIVNRQMQTRRVGVARPLEAFGVSVMVVPSRVGWLPSSLLQAVGAAVRSMQVDDDIVHRDGLHGPWVPLAETQHPSCSRVRMSLCEDGRLNYYPNMVRPGTESARHMPPLFYELCAHLALCFQDVMEPAFRGRCPDLCAVQYFRGRAAMGWHTDCRPDPRRKDQLLGQQPGSPVLSLNLFEDFLFCTVPIRDGDAVDKKMKLIHNEEQAILLKHGDAMMWPASDDQTHKHRVVPPPGHLTTLRVSIVCRFSNDARPKLRFAPQFPYRIVHRGEESGDAG